MALARIFSRHPEQTATLSEQLQQQGYKVEVLSPDEAPTTLADLEIQLEVCDQAEVLRRAAELAARLHADIAVAPGALLTAPHEVATPALESSLPAVDFAVSPAAPEPVIPPADLKAANETAPARLDHPAQAARAVGAAVAACVARAAALFAFGRAEFHEKLEGARVRAVEARERRQGRLLELTRRRAEAERHAATLESSRHAEVVALQLHRESADALPASGSKPAPVNEHPPRQWRILRLHVRQWEATLAGLVSAAALFVAGLTVASFHSRPTLSANREASLPPASVTPQAAQAKPAPARPSPVLRKTTAKPATPARQTRRKIPQRRQELVADDVVVRRFATPKPTPRTQADGWKHFSDMSN